MSHKVGKSDQKILTLKSRVYPVLLNSIKVPVAMDAQRQLNQAWAKRISAVMDLDKIGTPVLNHRSGIYWVVDGQHRVWALIDNGFGDCKIECRVYEDLTDEQMADLFFVLNSTKHVSHFQKFKSAVKAGYPRESAIIRTVEINRCKVSQAGDDFCISAVGALGRVFDFAKQDGEAVLGKTVRAIRDAFGGDVAAFDARIIEGVGLVYNRYNGAIDERRMAEQLESVSRGCRGLIAKAESTKLRTGNRIAHCVAATVVDAYNKGANGPRRLTPWWKDAQAE